MEGWRALLPEGFADSIEGKALISMFSKPALEKSPESDLEENVIERFAFDEAEVKIMQKSKINPISKVFFETSDGEVHRPPRFSIGFNFFSTKSTETNIGCISYGNELDSLNDFIAAGGAVMLWLMVKNWEMVNQLVLRRGKQPGDERLLKTVFGCVNEHLPETWGAALREAEHSALAQACDETTRLYVRRKI